MTRMDYEQDKPMKEVSALTYILGHKSLLHKFLNEKIRKKDWGKVTGELMTKSPILLANFLKINYETSESERISKIIREISKEGMLTIMLGAKRFGKTAASIWLAEQLIRMEKKVYWFGFYPHLKKVYPEIRQVLDLRKIDDGTVIFDETLIMMFGREAMVREIRDRVKALPTMGHRGMSIIFISQSLRIDALIKDLADFLWFKPLFTYSIFDSGLRDVDQMVKYMLPFNKWENLVLNLHTQEPYIFSNPLPEKWDDDLSKPFSRLESRDEALEFFDKCRKAFSEREAVLMLEQRGWKLEELLSPTDKVELSVKKSIKNMEMMRCPECGSMDYIYWGQRTSKTKGVGRRYRCNRCGKTWTVY